MKISIHPWDYNNEVESLFSEEETVTLYLLDPPNSRTGWSRICRVNSELACLRKVRGWILISHMTRWWPWSTCRRAEPTMGLDSGNWRISWSAQPFYPNVGERHCNQSTGRNGSDKVNYPLSLYFKSEERVLFGWCELSLSDASGRHGTGVAC